MNEQPRLPILDAEWISVAAEAVERIDADELERYAAERLRVRDVIDAEVLNPREDEAYEWCDDCGGTGVVGLLGDDRLDVPCFTCNGNGRIR